MKRPARKSMAVLAIIAGVVVGVFEAANAGHSSRGEVWFWSIIAALTVLFGLAELIFPQEKP